MMPSKTNRKLYFFFFYFIGLISIISLSYADNLPITAARGTPTPYGFDSYTIINNYTKSDVAPNVLNLTRGFIYELDISTTQNTHRWVGYVGNISGNITLQDSLGNSLYAWELEVTSGEIYATRFNGGPGTLAQGAQRGAGQGLSAYNYVDWTNVSCASRDYIVAESQLLSHNISLDNDALESTFLNSSSFKSAAMDFEVSDRYIDMSNDISGGCSGTFLFTNPNGAQTDYWQMVVLEDGTEDDLAGDIIFASVIENDAVGFNGNTYDFQILLPQHGAVTTGSDDTIKDNIAYYFYLELVGERWPN